MKFLSFLLLFLLIRITISAQIPQGYYDAAAGLYGPSLQQALHDIIDNHTVISYDNLYDAFETTDRKPNGKVWDMYSDVPGGTPAYEYSYGSNDECGSYNSEGDCFNREHSWPKSWFSDKTPMYSDLFHLYPTDGYVNNRRSNYPFGKVGSSDFTSTNGSKVGSCVTPGYSGTVFEPIDEYKGDFARTYFYMATRYYNEDNGWAGSGMTNGSQLKPWAVTMLLQWSAADPVSQKEIDRNNAVYSWQHNRNPYIDHPEYSVSIWAPNAGIQDYASTVTLSCTPNPCSTTLKLDIPAQNLKLYPEVLVYSSTGSLVKVQPEWINSSVTMNVSSLPAGIYIIRINSSELMYSYQSRFIKL